MSSESRETQEIVISADGRIEFVYTDDLQALLDEGESTLFRASHVEPDPANPKLWTADLSPVAPGVLLTGFTSRKDALDAEVQYIRQNVLTGQ